MLKAMLATAAKDLRLMSKDPGALAVLFVMPLVFILVMSLAMARMFDPAARPLTVAVADEDRGPFAAEFLRQLKAAGGFEAITESEGRPLDRAAAERLVAARRQQVAVVLPSGLSDAIRAALANRREGARDILVVLDPALSPQIAAPLRGGLNGIAQQAAFVSASGPGIDQMVEQLRSRGGSVPEDFTRDLKTRAGQAGGGGAPLVTIKEQLAANGAARRPNSVEQNVPAYTLLALFFIAMQLSANVFEERRTGAFRRLLAAPAPAWAILTGKLAAFASINLVQVAAMFSIGVFLLPLLGAPPMSFGAHPLALVVVTVAVALAANALGLLLAAVARTPAQSTGLGLIVVLTSAMLGGVMVPRFVMPSSMQTIGLISPHAWGLDAYQDVLMRGAGVVDVTPAVAALLGFAAIAFAIALWRFRWD